MNRRLDDSAARGASAASIRPSPGWIAIAAVLIALIPSATHAAADQPEGRAAFDAFVRWKNEPANSLLSHGDALKTYRERLKAEGASDAVADRTIRMIVAHDEGELYNRIYAAAPTFDTQPNRLLAEAIRGVTPGRALDVGMGQGRNALHLAQNGWDVTGFDVAEVGLQKARERAAAAGLAIQAVHASDEEFDFGRERWDLIAVIYALEKRSVHRVRDALRPGGLVVIEAGHTDTSDSVMEYRSNELLEIFKSFRILRYEETQGRYDWGPEEIRLVRLVAQKPR